jgi:HlyD family secretion protein
MTASVRIEIAGRDDVLRVPAAALRFRPSAQLLESLNAPVEAPARPADPSGATGQVWMMSNGTIAPVPVRLGISDGMSTEVIEPPFQEGAQVVTGAAGGSSARAASTRTTTGNPFFGASQGGPGRR